MQLLQRRSLSFDNGADEPSSALLPLISPVSSFNEIHRLRNWFIYRTLPSAINRFPTVIITTEARFLRAKITGVLIAVCQ